jgi:hypothetical protein
MYNLKFYLLLLCVSVASTLTYAQEKPYPIGNSANVLSNFRRQLTSVKPNGINRLQLPLPSTRNLQAVINSRKSSGTASEHLAGSIANVPNSSFYLWIENKSVQGHILLRDSKKAYTYSSDNNGTVFVQETDINKIICIDYEKAPEPASASVAVAEAATATGTAGFYDQQSYPQGKGCVLLDFDGEIVTGTFWNNSIPDGASIKAAPANISDADKQQTWENVSESFRFLSLNITTSEAVYNTYPVNKRMRCIFTPTNVVAPGAGGVAYIGSFKWPYDNPCWVFMSSGKRISDAAVHEIGHTLDLYHDGRPGETYYRGHGYWAPVMGVGYDKPLVQWSKGEYANANNKEDDLNIMSGSQNDVGYRADDHGNTTTAATLLTMDTAGNVSSKGIIERTADVDMFSFTTTGGLINLTFKPNAYYPALDILATLYDNNGTVITTSDSSGLHAGISTTLAAGTYYVSVTGTGFGNPENTGYSNYGSLGTYNITGTIPIRGADIVAGKCLKMDGSSTEISLGKVNINSNNFSISCWIKPDGLQKPFSQIIGWNPAPALGKGFGIGFTFNRGMPTLHLKYTDTIVGWGAGADWLFADTATWNFVVLTYSPTGVKIYMNGETEIVNNSAMPVINLSQHPFYVNRDIHAQGGAYKGAIDEIKFYNYALSQNEVREKMHLIQNNATAETGLLKYFQFNQYDSATGTVPDLMSDFKATIPNGSFIVPSTAPVATGTVFRISYQNFRGGQFSFPGTGVDIFMKKGFYAWGDVAVFRLNSSPDKQPDSLLPVPKSQYFIINTYGAPITSPDSIRFSGLNLDAGYQATDFGMYTRHSGGWGNTWGTQVSRSTGFNYAPGSSSITFGPGNNVTRFGQFALSAPPVTARVSLAAARAAETLQPANVSTTVTFYPNPTKGLGYLNITSPNTNGRVMVSLQDMNGNIVYQASEQLSGGGKTSLLLMFNAHSSGIYILKIRFSTGEVITKKVVIVK